MVPSAWLSLIHLTTIGNTGVGKSALCNFLSGKKDGQHMAFPVSEKIDAFTNKTTAQLERWLGKGEEYILVDTPGLGDPSGRDSLHIAEMVKELKQLEYMNAFLILFNAQNPRLDESLRAMIDIFTQIFGVERFFNNVILVFTRWDHGAKAERKRQRTGETRANREMEFNRYFREAFRVDHTLPSLFIDAYPDPDDQDEIDSNLREVVRLKEYAVKFLPFPLEDAEIVRGYLDQMKDKIGEESNRADVAEIEAEKNAKLAQEEIAGRQKDKEDFENEKVYMAEKHSEEVKALDKRNEEQKEIWQKDKAEYERKQREYEERIREAREERRGLFSFTIGPVHVEL